MNPILGIDVSLHNWKRGIPYAMLPRIGRAGVEFVGARASIGTVKDPSFEANIRRVRGRGWLAVAYHFLEGGIPAHAQAETFAEQVHTVGANNLLTVLDVERGGRPSYPEAVAFAAKFDELVPRHDLGLYSNRSTWASFGNPDIGAHFDYLWQAYYSVNHQVPPPPLEGLPSQAPHGFGGMTAPLWQWGPYIIGGHALDGDAYYGDFDDLKALGMMHLKPVKDRPGFRLGYSAMLGMATSAVGALVPPEGGVAFTQGALAAQSDALDAIESLHIQQEA